MTRGKDDGDLWLKMKESNKREKWLRDIHSYCVKNCSENGVSRVWCCWLSVAPPSFSVGFILFDVKQNHVLPQFTLEL